MTYVFHICANALENWYTWGETEYKARGLSDAWLLYGVKPKPQYRVVVHFKKIVQKAENRSVKAEEIEAIIDRLKPWCCGAFTGWVGKTGDSRITLDEAEDHFSLCMLDMQDDLRGFLNGQIA